MTSLFAFELRKYVYAYLVLGKLFFLLYHLQVNPCVNPSVLLLCAYKYKVFKLVIIGNLRKHRLSQCKFWLDFITIAVLCEHHSIKDSCYPT